MNAAVPTENLHPDLLKLFNQFHEVKERIEGREYQIDLTLKIGTDRHLVFADSFMQVEGRKTKYQIAKWKFTPEQTKDLAKKKGSICRVHFKVEEVRTETPYSDMPHILAKIISITALTPKTEQGMGGNVHPSVGHHHH